MPQGPTYERILQVAEDVFTDKGFGNASVSEICTRAGVSPPTLYYHFGNKDGLFCAVVERTLCLDAFCKLLRQALAASPDVWTKLRAYVRTYLTHFPTYLLNPGLHLQDSTDLNATSLQQLEAGLAEAWQLAVDLLREGMAGGEFRQLGDVQGAAACLMGTVDSFVRARTFLGTGYDTEQAVECIIDLFEHGLKA
jgi:AcrR family transcriptional regulator